MRKGGRQQASERASKGVKRGGRRKAIEQVSERKGEKKPMSERKVIQRRRKHEKIQANG